MCDASVGDGLRTPSVRQWTEGKALPTKTRRHTEFFLTHADRFRNSVDSCFRINMDGLALALTHSVYGCRNAVFMSRFGDFSILGEGTHKIIECL